MDALFGFRTLPTHLSNHAWIAWLGLNNIDGLKTLQFFTVYLWNTMHSLLLLLVANTEMSIHFFVNSLFLKNLKNPFVVKKLMQGTWSWIWRVINLFYKICYTNIASALAISLAKPVLTDQNHKTQPLSTCYRDWQKWATFWAYSCNTAMKS